MSDHGSFLFVTQPGAAAGADPRARWLSLCYIRLVPRQSRRNKAKQTSNSTKPAKSWKNSRSRAALKVWVNRPEQSEKNWIIITSKRKSWGAGTPPRPNRVSADRTLRLAEESEAQGDKACAQEQGQQFVGRHQGPGSLHRLTDVGSSGSNESSHRNALSLKNLSFHSMIMRTAFRLVAGDRFELSSPDSDPGVLPLHYPAI